MPLSIRSKQALHLRGLTIMKLMNCNLTSTAVSTIPEMGSLRILDLSLNNIEYLNLKSSTRNSLLSINLSHNKIEQLANLNGPFKQLISLNLNFNRLCDLNFQLVNYITPSLLFLYASNNYVYLREQNIWNSKFESVVCSLELTHNQCSIIDALFAPRCAFARLNLTENAIFMLPEARICSPLLQELILDRNALTSLAEINGAWLPNLYLLSANDNRIQEFPPLQLPQLSILKLRNNCIFDINKLCFALGSSLSLRELDVNGNPFTLNSNAESIMVQRLPFVLSILYSPPNIEKAITSATCCLNKNSQLDLKSENSFLSAFQQHWNDDTEVELFIAKCKIFTHTFHQKMVAIKKYFSVICPEQVFALAKPRPNNTTVRIGMINPPDQVLIQPESIKSKEVELQKDMIHSSINVSCFNCKDQQKTIERFSKALMDLRKLIKEHLNFQSNREVQLTSTNEDLISNKASSSLEIDASCLQPETSDVQCFNTNFIVKSNTLENVENSFKHCQISSLDKSINLDKNHSLLSSKLDEDDAFIFEKSTRRLENFAIKIQALWRGYRVRKWSAHLLDAIRFTKSPLEARPQPTEDEPRLDCMGTQGICREVRKDNSVTLIPAEAAIKIHMYESDDFKKQDLEEEKAIDISDQNNSESASISWSKKCGGDNSSVDNGYKQFGQFKTVQLDWAFQSEKTMKRMLERAKKLKIIESSHVMKNQQVSQTSVIRKTSRTFSSPVNSEEEHPTIRVHDWLTKCNGSGESLSKASSKSNWSINSLSSHKCSNSSRAHNTVTKRTQDILPQLEDKKMEAVSIKLVVFPDKKSGIMKKKLAHRLPSVLGSTNRK